MLYVKESVAQTVTGFCRSGNPLERRLRLVQWSLLSRDAEARLLG